MTRLVNSMRDQIVDNLIVHTFGERCLRQVDEKATLALMVYNDVYSAADRKRMDDLPEGWLVSDTNIKCRADERDFMLSFNGYFNHGHIKQVLDDLREMHFEEISKRFPNVDHKCYLKVYAKSDKIGKRLIEYGDTNAVLVKDIKEATQKATVMLAKFSTIEKLIEAWPEIEPMTRNVSPAPMVSNVPMIPTAALNELFGLPVK